MPPDEMFGVELRPIRFENPVLGIQFIPQLSARMWRHDRNLRDVELERRQRREILADRFRRFGWEADDVGAMRVFSSWMHPRDGSPDGRAFLSFVALLELFFVKALDSKQPPFHPLREPFVEIA